MSDTVNNSEIIKLEFPESVRLRHGMYLPHKTHMITEIVDNSVDEFTAGHATGIAVYIQDGIVTVIDNGRGIPVGVEPRTGKVQAELAFTELHSGGKFGKEGSGYKGIKATGLHGVGASVVNALSEWCLVRSKRDGKHYELGFQQGIKVKDLTEIANGLELSDTGTEVIFKSDDVIWGEEEFNEEAVKDRLEMLAYLNSGLTLYLYIQNGEEVQEYTYYFEEGLKTYIENRTKNKTLVSDILAIAGKSNGVEVNIAMVYTDSYNTENIASFCNNAATVDGGDHITGFKAAINKSINDYIVLNNVKAQYDFDTNDLLEGLTAAISVKVQDPVFDGQGKSRIRMTSVRRAVRAVMEEFLREYFEYNPDIANALLNKMQGATKARLAAQKAREASRKIKETSDNPTGLAGKLSPCTSKVPEDIEIYIVEGDSAGGSAKQARDRQFQAILPIFGKPLNVEKQRLHKVVANERLMDFARALGCGIGEEFDYSKLRYHTVVIMSDADVDGSHIKILWSTFVYRYMKPLIENGNLYFSCPPLYKLVINKENVYAKDDIEKEELIAKHGNKVTNVQRFKGLGEMNASQLWETTMDPSTRTLERITLEDIEKDEYILSLCMGEEVKPRKEFIMEHSLEANLDY